MENELLCCVCFDIELSVYITDCCNKIICSTCSKKINTCPFKHKKFTLRKPDPFVEKCIKNY